MQLVSRKSRLTGTVSIPASKSHTIRAVAIASLAQGQSLIHNPLSSADAASAVSTYRALGATIDTSDPKLWKVTGTGGQIQVSTRPVDVGNSGTTLNIALGSASLSGKGQTITFVGDQQTQSRPIGPILNSLTELGAKGVSVNNNGKAPAKVTGQLLGGKTSIACSTSQYLSSLLLCTPLALKDSEINVTLLNEPGYAQMTLDWLDSQGIQYRKQQMKKFSVKGRQSYKPFDRPVPADFSSATFFLCAGALVGEEVMLLGLDFHDSQPDKAVVDYLKGMGAKITVQNDTVTVRAAGLKGIEIDMNKTPDALPAMSVTAAFAEGVTRLVNVPQARGKETDRIACMAQELRKLSVEVEELPDGLVIHGGRPKPAAVHGWGDHRIVMALALAGLLLDGPLTVDTAEAMSVTFPDYVKLMQSLGAQMETSD
ncbi:MAG: 3-phosphoshikimate 1-carboxyvinyltransferase [Planctomycetes bacterium]|nr:3-phosphoshikimate 1-carboxyvinyltransferase [Planctomycetota bacterium]